MFRNQISTDMHLNVKYKMRIIWIVNDASKMCVEK